MLRVVADPSVLVSAVLTTHGPPAQLIDRWREAEFELVVSPKLLTELEEVLIRPKFAAYADEHDVRSYVDALAGEAILISDPEDPEPLTRDPDDDYLVALALVSGADAIVSGDIHLTELADPPVTVVTPRAFLERLEESGR